MTKPINRKDFLRLSGAALLTAGLPAAAKAQPAPRGVARTLIKGGDVLTMEKGAADMIGADVLIEGEKIVAVGKNLRVDNAEVIAVPAGSIVMPGMIDGHRHIWENIDPTGVLKTNQTYLDYQIWKMKTMPAMTAEDFYLAEYTGALEAIDSGVTTVLDYAHGLHTVDRADAAARGIKDSGIAGTFCYQVAHDLSYGLNSRVPLRQANADRGGLPKDIHWQTAKMLREKHFASDDGLMRFGLSLSNNSGRDLALVADEVRRVRTFQPKLILHHNHIPEHPVAGTYTGTAADMKAVGLLTPDHHISHGVTITDEDLKIMAGAGVKICATPMVEFTYPWNESSVHGRAYKAGMDVGLGLDAPLEFTKDFFEQVRGGWWGLYRTQKDKLIADTLMSEDLLAFVTREGAKSAGVGDITGTLKAGKRADIIVINTERFGFPTVGSLADRVCNFAALTDIKDVWIAGKRRKADGQMVGIDWKSLKAKAVAAQAQIRRDAATVTFY